MEINLNITLFVKFDDNETCNPEYLAELRKYLDDMRIGYTVFDNIHLPQKNKIREIQIFCPKGFDHEQTINLSEKLYGLTYNYIPSPEMDWPEPKPEIIEPVEPKVLSNHKQVALDFNQRNNQNTPIEYYNG